MNNPVFAFGMLVGAWGCSYFLALAGEPQSVWIWRDVLGVLQ